MQFIPTITFRGMAHSDALEADIRSRITKLGRYHRSIIGCRVLIEFVQRHHEAGNRYHVRIDLNVPGEEIAVAHEASLHAAAQARDAQTIPRHAETDPVHKHVYVAVRDAFDIARRRLQDRVRRRRGTVKTSARQPHGRVARLFPDDAYGYIKADDGREVYFQKSSVLKHAFDRLVLGSDVSFTEERGEKGLQAGTVKLLHPKRTRHRALAARSKPALR